MAQYEDLTIDQGSDVAVEIYVVDTNNAAKNLSNYSVNAKLKKHIIVIALIPLHLLH